MNTRAKHTTPLHLTVAYESACEQQGVGELRNNPVPNNFGDVIKQMDDLIAHYGGYSLEAEMNPSARLSPANAANTRFIAGVSCHALKGSAGRDGEASPKALCQE